MNKTIEIDIFNREWYTVVVIGKEPYLKRALQKYGYPKSALEDGALHDLGSNGSQGLTFYADGLPPIIILPVFPKTSKQVSTLAHEAVHAVNDIYEKIGEEDAANCHIFAVSVGTIVRAVLEKK